MRLVLADARAAREGSRRGVVDVGGAGLVTHRFADRMREIDQYALVSCGSLIVSRRTMHDFGALSFAP